MLAVYVYCMFVHPWFGGAGRWAHVQDVWDRWQTLNAGALAFAASVIAINITRFNERRQRERDFVAARAFLPHTLSGLMEYYRASAAIYKTLWDNGGTAPNPLREPELPVELKEVFKDCIRFAEPAIGERLSSILVKLQVHGARLRDALIPVDGEMVRRLDRASLISYLYRLGQLHALTGQLFSFARGEAEFEDHKLGWDDLSNSFGILDIEVEDIVAGELTLQKFSERQLAKAGG